MKIYAYIAIFEALMKLVVSFAIVISPFDKLISYSFLTVLTAILVRAAYSYYCRKKFECCKFHFNIHFNLLKEMMAFVGWAFLGNGAVVIRDQGTNMILNLFGGTTINAARGIAQNVNNAVITFANNFMQATQPEITKLKATDQLDEMRNLIFRSCRIAYFLMLVLSLPIIKNIDYILQIWLGEVPAYTNIFIILTLIDSMIASLNNPLLYGVLACGQIKIYEIVMSSMCILCMPIIYGILYIGAIPVYVYIVIVVLRFLITLILIWQSKIYGLRWEDFLYNVGIRVLAVTFISISAGGLISFDIFKFEFLNFFVESGILFIFTGIITFSIGLTKPEKIILVKLVKSKALKR